MGQTFIYPIFLLIFNEFNDEWLKKQSFIGYTPMEVSYEYLK